MKALNLRGIPEDLHREFKATCVRKDITMQDAILMFMKETEASGGTIIESLREKVGDAEPVSAGATR